MNNNIKLFITPKMLRNMADTMEKIFQKNPEMPYITITLNQEYDTRVLLHWDTKTLLEENCYTLIHPQLHETK